jgi:hypothetical protein
MFVITSITAHGFCLFVRPNSANLLQSVLFFNVPVMRFSIVE